MKDYLERCNDVIRKAEEENLINEFMISIKPLVEVIPSIIKITKNVYDEMIKNGFNEA